MRWNDAAKLSGPFAFEAALLDYFNSENAALRDEINETGDYSDDIAAKLKACVESFKSSRTF